MANWTAAQLRNAALTKLGIIGQGETAQAGDAALVDAAWVSLHPQLRKEGLAPFTSSAIPEWAQQPVSKRLAGEVAEDFGLPQGEDLRRRGTRDLARQNATEKAPVRVRVSDFL